ncbi:MAG: enoyl-CoA hydratase-related protein [Candidatus Thorarchaeota archaeon]
MSFETLLYESKNKIGYITLNRPEKHNAMNYQMLDDLDAVFDHAEEDKSVNAIVLRGNGKSFCSGYDLRGSYYTTAPEGGWNVRNLYNILEKKIYAKYLRLWKFPKPTVAQIHGHCLAAGCYLQLLCDISIAADDANLGHPATRGGFSTSMPLWQVYLGVKKARYLLMTGLTIDGKEAERIGLVSLSVPREKLEEKVGEIATRLATVPPNGALHGKITLNTALEIMGVNTLFTYHGQRNKNVRLIFRP